MLEDLISLEDDIPDLEQQLKEEEELHLRHHDSFIWAPRDFLFPKDHELYIPQYCATLAHSATISSVLRDFLWEKCSKETHFAQKVFWELSSVVQLLENASKKPSTLW